MKTSLKERIIESLLIGVLMYILLCFINQFSAYRNTFLSYPALFSVVWAVAVFVSKTLQNMEENWKTLGKVLIITILVFILLVFVLGVVCDIKDWANIVGEIAELFALAMIVEGLVFKKEHS